MELVRAWENTPQTREAFNNLLRNKAPGMGTRVSQVKDFVVPNLPPLEHMDGMIAPYIRSLAQRKRRSRRSKRKRRKSRKSRRRPRF